MQADTFPIHSPTPAPEAALVSVIVRSMDRPTLGAALASIAAQTHRPVEVIIVNACGARHRPLPLSCADLPVVPVATADGSPLPRAQAANRGLAAVRGPLALFLDDDDLLLPSHLTRLVAALQDHSQAPAAYADAELGRIQPGDGDAAWTAIHPFDSSFDPLRLRFENYLPIHAVLFRHPGSEVQFDESFDLFEDWDFWLQLATRGDFIHVPGVSARYVVSGEAQSDVFADTPAARVARERLYEKWRLQGTPAQHAALLRRLQTLYRQAAQAVDELAASRSGQAVLQKVLDARDNELADAETAIADLRGMLAARDTEVGNTAIEIDGLHAVIGAREREIAASIAELNAVKALVARRQTELADAAVHAQSLQDTTRAREGEIAEATRQIQSLEDVLAERQREVANAALHAQGLQNILVEREREIADAAAHVNGLEDVLRERTRAAESEAARSQALTERIEAQGEELRRLYEELEALRSESPWRALNRTLKGKKNEPR